MFEFANKKLVALLAPVGLAVGLTVGAGNAMAGHYLTAANGTVVKNGSGKCWYAAQGVEKQLPECGDVVAQAPKDSDGDGVPDSKDQCPNTPRGVAVNSVGCPLDSDGDGVPNYLDRCPGTPAGTKVDASGCPVKTMAAAPAAINDTMSHFAFDSAKLKPAMKTELDKIASEVKGTSTKLEVIGYTDSTGPAAYNQMLSERRAQSAADYLESMGVSNTTVKGMGENDPIASNATRAGRSMNRRVEVRSH